MAEAESGLATFFGGRNFRDEILGNLQPGLQLVVARQQFPQAGVTPAIKLPAAAVVLRAAGERTRVLGVPAPAKRLEPHGLCHLEAWLDVVVCRFEPQGLGGAGVGARGGAWAAPDVLGAQAGPPITVSQGALRGMRLRPAR